MENVQFLILFVVEVAKMEVHICFYIYVILQNTIEKWIYLLQCILIASLFFILLWLFWWKKLHTILHPNRTKKIDISINIIQVWFKAEIVELIALRAVLRSCKAIKLKIRTLSSEMCLNGEVFVVVVGEISSTEFNEVI